MPHVERHVNPCGVAWPLHWGMWRMARTAVCNASYSTAARVKSMVRGSAAFAFGQQRPRMSKMPAEIAEAGRRVSKSVARPELRAALDDLLAANRSACTVHADYYASEAVRDRVLPSVDTLPRTQADYDTLRGVAAYVAWQMPLAYACIERVFAEIHQRAESFAPRSVLDFGSGPGTASLCALRMFPTVSNVEAVDISENMLIALQTLWDECGRGVTLAFSRFLPAGIGKHDLVVCAFSLSELADEKTRTEILNDLLLRCTDTLVVIERGTPEGARIISEARTALLASSHPLHIIAPCPHDKPCPMRGSWCHFAQRVEMTAVQMELHAVNKGFEDQKLSYLVVRRGPRPAVVGGASSGDPTAPANESVDNATVSSINSDMARDSYQWPRLIRRPLKRQGHVVQDYCSPSGTFTRTVVSRACGKAVYRDARKARWGDLWPHPPRNAVRVLETLHVKRPNARRRHLTIESDHEDDFEE